MRINEKELKVIKDVFAENEPLLILVRNLFFGLNLTEEEKKNIKESFKNLEIRRIIRKFIIPEFDADIPIGFSTDVWMSSVDGIKSNSPETLQPIFDSQIKWIGMMETALKLLENPDGTKVSLAVMTGLDPTDMYIQILARNNFVKAIETALIQIKTWAGTRKESVEDTRKRLLADSSK